MSFSKINLEPISQDQLVGFSMLILDTFEPEWLLSKLLTFPFVNLGIKRPDTIYGVNNDRFEMYISKNPSGSTNILVICHFRATVCELGSFFLGWSGYKIQSMR